MWTVCRIAGTETCPGVCRPASSLKFSCIAIAEAEVNPQVAFFDPAGPSECNDSGLNYPIAFGATCQQPDPAHTERPCGSRTAEPRDKFAPSHLLFPSGCHVGSLSCSVLYGNGPMLRIVIIALV